MDRLSRGITATPTPAATKPCNAFGSSVLSTTRLDAGGAACVRERVERGAWRTPCTALTLQVGQGHPGPAGQAVAGRHDEVGALGGDRALREPGRQPGAAWEVIHQG